MGRVPHGGTAASGVVPVRRDRVVAQSLMDLAEPGGTGRPRERAAVVPFVPSPGPSGAAVLLSIGVAIPRLVFDAVKAGRRTYRGAGRSAVTCSYHRQHQVRSTAACGTAGCLLRGTSR